MRPARRQRRNPAAQGAPKRTAVLHCQFAFARITWIDIAVWPSLKVVKSLRARHRDSGVARNDFSAGRYPFTSPRGGIRPAAAFRCPACCRPEISAWSAAPIATASVDGGLAMRPKLAHPLTHQRSRRSNRRPPTTSAERHEGINAGIFQCARRQANSVRFNQRGNRIVRSCCGDLPCQPQRARTVSASLRRFFRGNRGIRQFALNAIVADGNSRLLANIVRQQMVKSTAAGIESPPVASAKHPAAQA